MQGLFRSFTALFMAFTLVFTAQAMASARTMTTPNGEIILCTGTGPVAIQVDINGNPTGPPHICPDCAMSFLDGMLPDRVAQIARVYRVAERLRPSRAVPLPSQNLAPFARGPPVWI